MPAFAFSVSKIVSSSRISQPPSIETAHLIFVRGAQLVERHRAERGIVDVGRDRQRAVRRAHRAGDEPRPIRRARGPFVGRRAREPRALDVQLVGERLEAVVGLRDGGAAERVRLDDVGAGLEVLVVDLADDSGRVRTRRSLLPLQVARVIARSARRGSRPPSACSAGSSSPSRRRG